MSGTEESDQLPEEGPGSQVPDDDGQGGGSSQGDSPGTPGSDEGQSTGNPASAGSEEREDG